MRPVKSSQCSGAARNAATLTLSHTIANNPNRAVIGIAMHSTGDYYANLTSMTFGGSAMTILFNQAWNYVRHERIVVGVLDNPAVGAQSFIPTFSRPGVGYISAAAVDFYGVYSGTHWEGFTSESWYGSGPSPSSVFTLSPTVPADSTLIGLHTQLWNSSGGGGISVSSALGTKDVESDINFWHSNAISHQDSGDVSFTWSGVSLYSLLLAVSLRGLPSGAAAQIIKRH